MAEPNEDKDTQQAAGLECRRCGCQHFRVIYTRRVRNGQLVRRRECRHCGKRMTTIEQEKGNGKSD